MRDKNPTPNPLPASEEGAKMYLIRAETAVRYEDRTPFTPPTSDRTPITAIPRSRFAIALPHPQKAITFPHPQTAIPRSR